jgi:5-methylcytosine-specific restriction endonuclease McrA
MTAATTDRPWLAWYDKARWIKMAKAQLTEHPLCAMCLKTGAVVPATICDHIIPHRGNARKFWYGELQSLCWSHHSRDKARLEIQGFSNDTDINGYPSDPLHPFNKRRG